MDGKKKGGYMNPDVLLAEAELKVNARTRETARQMFRKAKIIIEAQSDVQTSSIEAPVLSEETRRRLLRLLVI